MIGALSFEQLRIFVAVCDHGGFSAAARALGRVQSAVSQSVRTLEENHQVRLFERAGRGISLTQAGRTLADQARQVLRQAGAFEQIAASISAGMEPEFNLVVDSFVPTSPIVDSLRLLRDRFPLLPVTLFTEGLWAGQRRIRDGSAGMAVGLALPTTDQDLRAFPLFPIELLSVVGVTHPLATHSGPISRETLQQHTQLVLTDASERNGPSYTVISTSIWRFVEMARRIDFLEAGFGWANIPDHLALPRIAAGSLVELAIDDPIINERALSIYAFHQRMRPLGEASRWFLDHMNERFANRHFIDGVSMVE